MNVFFEFLVLSGMLAFLLTILMHLTRKNTTLIGLYLLQSLMLAFFLGTTAYVEKDMLLVLPAVLALLVKVILAPYFFLRFIKRSKEYFTSRTYLGIPFSLFAILLLSLFLSTRTFPLLATMSAGGAFPLEYMPFYVFGMFLSLFLIVNHKDMLAQIIGILSLENWIVFAGIAVGVRQSLALELGITFDIAVWILIVTIFVSMLHRTSGSMNVAKLTHLKEQ